MKIWKDYPDELAAWQESVRAERRRLLKHAEENEWVTELELPKVPNDQMISLSQAEWRKVWSSGL